MSKDTSSASRLSRSRMRLSEERRRAGIRGMLRMVAGYAAWRVRGSPHDGLLTYDEWFRTHLGQRPGVSTGPLITVVCSVFNTPPRLLNECIDSVYRQTFQHWELVLVDDASTVPDTAAVLSKWRARDGRISVIRNDENLGISRSTNRAIAEATGEYVVFIDHDDLLAPTALEWIAACAPDADIIYSDEDKVDAAGNHADPVFKPAWSPRLLLGVNYINHMTSVRTSVLRKVGGLRLGFDGAQDHDLLLRLAELPLNVAHVPNVLYHWRTWAESTAGTPWSKVEAETVGRTAVRDALLRRGWNAEVGAGRLPFNHQVRFLPEQQPPTVKIVIPTRDKVRLLSRVVDGVFNRTDGVSVHLVVVDNGSRKDATLRYLEGLESDHANVTVVRIDDAFNYSRLSNAGAAAGPDSELLLLLNNDVEIIHRNWLLQLSGWLRDPQVVASGPKLLFPDRTIQHAGVVIGMGGLAGHYSAGLADEAILGNLHDQAREIGCLTAATLLLRSSDFLKLGGFNEDLETDFQDVDLCLRLRMDLGGYLMYDPTYPLIHKQSASRGAVGAASNYTVARMKFLWHDVISAPDPFYNPHLTLDDHDLSLRSLGATPEERLARSQPRTHWGAQDL